MDCYLDEVDAELRHLLRMDCYLDEVQPLVHQMLAHSHRLLASLVLLAQQLLLLQRLVMP